jgi:hypothetical protein
MSELVTKSVAQEQQEQQVNRRQKHAPPWNVSPVLASLRQPWRRPPSSSPRAVYAQNKYALKSPGGIAFSDFRGYEDW